LAKRVLKAKRRIETAVRRSKNFLKFEEGKKVYMALLTQFASFFISPFGEKTVTDELNAFLNAHRIVNVEKRLIDGERGTGWVFLIEFGADSRNQASNTQTQRIDYREVLNEADYALFDKLRNIRKELAEKLGIPVYAVFSNEQLAGMVKKQPKTAKELQSIAGIGEARVKQHGEAFVQFFLARERHTDEKSGQPF
jgi:superfamily II DNA helicase RecQ